MVISSPCATTMTCLQNKTEQQQQKKKRNGKSLNEKKGYPTRYDYIIGISKPFSFVSTLPSYLISYNKIWSISGLGAENSIPIVLM